ncbi:MAG: hypothetical protein KTR30_24270 [Saprospiraceae bacterium]|nr:hypothetical protein [Saprospiraceae bacterium]
MKINHLTILGLCLCIFFAACKKDDDDNAICDVEIPAGTRFFEFQNDSGATFHAWTNKADVIAAVEAQLNLPLEQRGQHINGKIARIEGNCAINQNWSWYFLPDDWVVADASIELCDGNPQYVEDHLEDYLAIERYCPWGSKVLKEVTQPF